MKITYKSVLPFFAMLLCFFLSACGGDYADTESTKFDPVTENNVSVSDQKTDDALIILALGDSLTEGLGVNKDANYPAILERRLRELGHTNIKVVNSGLSGETSSGLKARLDWVLQLKPQITILNTGANDAMRGLPLELTTQNINEIVDRIQASGSIVILSGMQIYDNLGQEYVVGFKDMYPKIAEQHDLVMIPFFLEHVAGDRQLNQSDMIHPNREGYEIIVDKNILPRVLEVLETEFNKHRTEHNKS